MNSNDLELESLPPKSADPSLHRVIGRAQSTSSSHVDASPINDASPEQLRKYAAKERLQFATLSFSLFMAGWNDGSSGPLLPRIQSVYSVRYLRSIYAIINLITGLSGQFCNCCSYLRLRMYRLCERCFPECNFHRKGIVREDDGRRYARCLKPRCSSV